MDLGLLKQMTAYQWQVKNQAVPVELYASENLVSKMDNKVLEQLINVTKLPGLVGKAMAMPDAHWGYGFPIGGVAAFDPERGGIICAGGVGFDISCGIRCLRTNLFWEDIVPYAQSLGEALFNIIPAGVGVEGKLKLSPIELDEILLRGAQWAVDRNYGIKEDLLFIEDHGSVDHAKPNSVSELAKSRQKGEMGTLGSGNHYLEIQVIKEILDSDAASAYGISENQVFISIHCGSRGLGHQIGTDYLVSLAREAKALGINLPDRELACAPINSEIGAQYLGAMNAGINCALANRQILAHLTRITFEQIVPRAIVETFYDVSHNTCKKERHQVDGRFLDLYVHRKGATRAFGPNHEGLPEIYRATGQPVVIGGSMGTASYILAGNSPQENTAFASASHGAGRSMSRRQALKQWNGRMLLKELAGKGIHIYSQSMRGIAEEAPAAYKDVNEVAIATEKAGLARRVALLSPKICIKG